MTRQLQAAAPQAQSTPVRSGVLQRVCACGQHAEGGECEACRRKREGTLQRAAISADGGAIAPPIVHEVLNAPGQPLDTAIRAFMEPRFGHDFSGVRVHTDGQAAQSARAVNALAYTVGNHVAFDTGQYRPDASDGRRLLAHELAHVVQQAGATPTVQRLIVDDARPNAAEREARQAVNRVTAGHAATVAPLTGPAVMQRQATTAGSGGVPGGIGDPAGGCGICYRSNVKLVGEDVHTQVQAQFHRTYPILDLTSEQILNTPLGRYRFRDGIPDLALLTPTKLYIGEIKPANAENLTEGYSKMLAYIEIARQLFRDLGLPIQPDTLELPPPRPFPFREPANLTCPQSVYVVPVGLGVYAYHCIPPFSGTLRRTCRCRGDRRRQPERVPVPVPSPERQWEEQRARRQQTEAELQPLPGKELVPVGLVGLAALAATMSRRQVASWLAKKAAGRVAAPAMVIGALVLVGCGAELKVGLEGDDVLESLFKLAEQKGAPIPDDLKATIRADPELNRLLTEAAQTGNYTEAQRRLGEQLTRTVIENRDQFSDEELRELLTVTDQNSNLIPNAPATGEALRQALDQRGRMPSATNAPGTGAVAGPGPAAETPTAPGAGSQAATAPPAPTTPVTGPQAAAPTRPVPTTPAQRLEAALTRQAGEGPRADADALQRLRAILAAADPPLTDAEVDALIPLIQSAAGKTIDEVLASIERRITSRSAPSAGATEGDGVNAPAAGAERRERAALTEESIAKSPAYAGGREDTRLARKLRQQLKGLEPGQLVVAIQGNIVFVDGRPFRGTIAGRDAGDVYYRGEGTIVPRRVSGRWVLDVPAGIVLNGARGVYGTTRAVRIPAIPGVGEGPQGGER